jgi:hypothetical protein
LNTDVTGAGGGSMRWHAFPLPSMNCLNHACSIFNIAVLTILRSPARIIENVSIKLKYQEKYL